jgi:DnaJ-class molecular chaperone
MWMNDGSDGSSRSAHMSGLDIDAWISITGAEADRGVTREVTVTRFVRCGACGPTYRQNAGCSACTDGLTTRDETLSVKVPSGIVSGAKLRLAAKGHESTREISTFGWS